MNTFKKGDVVEAYGERFTVKYTDGPYVYGRNYGATYFDDCTLVPQPKFKAGDVVRCLKDLEGQFTTGKTYEVRKSYEDMIEDRISIVRDDLGSTSNGWAAKFFELATAPKFKVGDKVTTSGVDDAGVGTILGRADFSDTAWSVKFDTWYGVCGEEESNLTLANDGWSVSRDTSGFVTGTTYTPKPSPTIVVRKDRNGYAPNQNPRVHDTVELAKKEAERLALANPGVEFATFTLAGTSKATVSTVSV